MSLPEETLRVRKVGRRYRPDRDLGSTTFRSQLELSLSDSVSFRRGEPDEHTGLPFRSALELAESTPEEPDWLCHGFLAVGSLTLLSAVPKAGKSTLVAALVGALTRGEPFLDRKTRRCKVVMLSEERTGTLIPRLRRFRVGENVSVLMYHDAGGFPWTVVVSETIAHARAAGAELLVVDTLSQWARVQGDDENSAGAVREVVEPLLLAAASGLAVLLVHHQRKSPGQHGEAIRGSNALLGVVDVSVELERPRADELATTQGVRLLRSTGRYDATPPQLAIALNESEYEVRGETLRTRVHAETREILALLKADGDGVTADDLADVTGIPRGRVHGRLREMFVQGDLERHGTGRKGDPYRFLLLGKETLPDETNSGS